LSSDVAARQERKSVEVGFRHPFFNRLSNECYFQRTPETDEPVMVVEVNKNSMALPFPGIKRELGLDEKSEDGAMLDMIGKSLSFVKALRIGDPIPSELLSGEASWEIEARHREVAQQRVTMQFVNWMTGGQSLITDPEQLAQLANDPHIRKMVTKAFGDAADVLGIGRDNKEQVLQFVATLTNELSYIEALRDQFRRIISMNGKIKVLRNLYSKEKSIFDVADQVARLSHRAVADYEHRFLEVDAQTEEIIAVVRNLHNQIGYIRENRDNLFIRLSAWADLLVEWDEAKPLRGADKPELLRRTYRFLAPRYMHVKEWVLLTGPRNNPQHKPLGGIMHWN
jgi:hypothetical protein